jgi:thermostable 8-oxoguanine DNA glycosylase
MEFVGRGKQLSVVLTRENERVLDLVVRSLAALTSVEPIGTYKAASAADVWWRLVGQVCVMGSAKFWDQAKQKPEVRTELSFSSTSDARGLKKRISQTLSKHNATRFPNRAAEHLVKLRLNDQIFRNNKITLFSGLTHAEPRDKVRNVLLERCSVFKLKSASDFMISVGLSEDVVALDSRILGFFKKYGKLDKTASSIQSNPNAYLAVERALRAFCAERGITLALLDRMLYRYTNESVVDVLTRNEEFSLQRVGI